MRETPNIKGILAKRSVMAFFSDPASHYSHRVRLVLAEKGVTVEIINISPSAYPADLAEVNPYMTLPVLVDRDLVLFETKIMMEYLDDRFPHPPLMPVYPVARAESRQYMHRIEQDWCRCVDVILNPRTGEKAMSAARKELTDGLTAIAPLFAEKPYFMSDEYSLVDSCLAPILWRLPLMGVNLPNIKATKPLHDYIKRLFARESFQQSLSDIEKEFSN